MRPVEVRPTKESRALSVAGAIGGARGTISRLGYFYPGRATFAFVEIREE
jgi:hypothetical protein